MAPILSDYWNSVIHDYLFVPDHIRYGHIGQVRLANFEYSPVCDTSCLAELIYDLINRQFY